MHKQQMRAGTMETSILVLIPLFCMHDMTDEVWDP